MPVTVRVRRSNAATYQELSVHETPSNARRETIDSGERRQHSNAMIPIPLDRLQRIEGHVGNLTSMLQSLQTRSNRFSQTGADSRGSSSSRGSSARTSYSFPDSGLPRASTNQSSAAEPSNFMPDLRYVDLSSLTLLCDEVGELSDLLIGQLRSLLQSIGGSHVASTSGYGEGAPSRVASQLTQSQRLSTITQLTSERNQQMYSTSGELDPQRQLMAYQMNSPNIDWSCLDEVLRGEEELEQHQGPSGEPAP